MNPFILSFLKKLNSTYSSFSPLSYSNLNPNVNKNYTYLKSILPNVQDSKLSALSIVLQYLNLTEFEVNELGALSNLNWHCLDSFLIEKDITNCILGKELIYDTKDGRVQLDYINDLNNSNFKLNALNYFNSGDINSLKNIIVYLMNGE